MCLGFGLVFLSLVLLHLLAILLLSKHKVIFSFLLLLVCWTWWACDIFGGPGGSADQLLST